MKTLLFILVKELFFIYPSIEYVNFQIYDNWGRTVEYTKDMKPGIYNYEFEYIALDGTVKYKEGNVQIANRIKK